MPTSSSPKLFGGGLDPNLEKHFAPLCAVLAGREVKELQEEVLDYVAVIHKALQHNEFLDVETAEQIADALIELLNEYNTYPESNQKLVVGAARYFVSPNDADPDTSSLLGLDDDATVLNYVLDTIGKPELKVEF